VTPPCSPPHPFAYPKSTPASTIKNAPTLQAILARARMLFKTKVVIVSMLSSNNQHFLASCGMPENVEVMPRTAAICAHTVLNGQQGMVVLDTQKDWR
jgi:purine nucleoside permease